MSSEHYTVNVMEFNHSETDTDTETFLNCKPRTHTHLDDVLRLDEPAEPALGEEGGVGLYVEEVDLPGHCAHLHQRQLS